MFECLGLQADGDITACVGDIDLVKALHKEGAFPLAHSVTFLVIVYLG